MKQSLNFAWNFVPSFNDEYLKELPKDKKVINIPHTVKEVPYNYFSEKEYQMISTYEKYFDVEDFNNKKIYFLRFDGFMVKAKIYLNDHYLGEYVSIYIPVEIDVSQYLKEKDNRLLVVLDSHEDTNYPPFGFALDYLTFGGIYREVYLVSELESYLKNIYVHGDMNGLVNITYEKIGQKATEIVNELYFEDKLVTTTTNDSFKIDNPKLWDINHPNLYTLKTVIKVDGLKETYTTRFGFRDIRFDNTGFYLNNQKVKLVGLNRHQGYPYIGYAASKSLQEDDADMMKYEIGLNVVRTSHYPQSKHFLNRCDEIGLMVINEIPGWQHIGESEIWRKQCLINTEMMKSHIILPLRIPAESVE